MSRLRASHRDEGPPSTSNDASSSSDEEDVFSALAKRGKGKKGTKLAPPGAPPLPKFKIKPTTNEAVSLSVVSQQSDDIAKTRNPGSQSLSTTSSAKRHHGVGAIKRQDLDSLLEELQEESQQQTQLVVQRKHRPSQPPSSHGGGGSYVRSGEENTTTNVFVGNLAPTTTQQQLAHFFGQFGLCNYLPEDGMLLLLSSIVAAIAADDISLAELNLFFFVACCFALF
jgi:RNA recognition motif. (a.k.a. RRM, RBD, or RNP domain)